MFKLLAIAGFLALASADPIRRLDGKIVGGFDIEIDDVPYQVSLRRLGSHQCGGSIISEKHVLTAGHCLGNIPSQYSVQVGSTDNTSGGIMHQVVKITSHNFSNDANGIPTNDITIVEVNPPFEFNEKCAPIRLYELKEEIKPGTIALISGWGKLSSGLYPTNLQAVEVPIISKQECNEAYSYLGGISEGQICAAYLSGGKDACQQDSGGPLAVDGQLVGIVSWGIGCGKPGNPGVYTEVAFYADWINEQLSV